jgi:hypothetical protein
LISYTTATNIGAIAYGGETVNSVLNQPGTLTFPLSNIDDVRTYLLRWDSPGVAAAITKDTQPPYGNCLKKGADTIDDYHQGWCKLAALEGLAVKTYQSDLFNNWISTEWIDGTNGVNEITSIDTSEGSFNIDTLNLANKVYNMLNRIALSGGTYDDWLDAVYTHERVKSIENPIYQGGLMRELVFQEVVSNAGTADDPLGTLAGRGVLGGKKKRRKNQDKGRRTKLYTRNSKPNS